MGMGFFSRGAIGCGLAIYFVFMPVATSQPRGSAFDSPTVLTLEGELPNQKSVTRGYLQFESVLYPQELTGTPLSQTDYMMLEVTHKSANKLRTGADLTAASFTNFPSSFFYVNELYIGRQLSRPFRVDIGRKREYWADFDREWDLSLWEPRANWDPLRPFQQGLAGIFAQVNYNHWDLLLMGSPLFVPTLGPEIAEKNGSLVSQSRWHRTPVASGPVLDRETQFFYSLEIPEIADLAQQTSLAARLAYGRDKAGWWSSAAVARKPLNPLGIKYDYNLAVTSSFSQAEVRVTPTVSYHELVTLEGGWQNENGRITLSAFADNTTTPLPINDLDDQGEEKTDWLQQTPQGISGGALHIQTVEPLYFAGRPLHVNAGYLHIQTQDSVDLDSKGEPRGSLLPKRFNWSQALQLRLKTESILFKRSLQTHVRWMRELEQEGVLLSIYNTYALSPRTSASLGFDILGVDNSSPDNFSPSFFNQFRTNDRVFGGVSYVF